MKTYLSDGNTLTVTVPAAVASGEGMAFGGLFGVAVTAAAAGEEATFLLTGVHLLPKAAGEAWTVGDPVHWNGKEATKAGKMPIGAAFASVEKGAMRGSVRLGATVPPSPNKAAGL